MRDNCKKAAVVSSIFSGAFAFEKMLFINNLEFFDFNEFGYQGLFLKRSLLSNLDLFRKRLDAPIIISPVPGAILRFDLKNSESQHFFLKGRALDVLLPANKTLERGLELALQCGFTGIGVYPDWKPTHGMHLDMRQLEPGAEIATWGGIRESNGRQVYVSVDTALMRA